MKNPWRAAHDVWCAVTGRCRVTPQDDPMLADLRTAEQAAYREAEASRGRQRQRRNIVEAAYLHGREGRHDRRQ